jgi:hypothetical protein
MSTISLYDQMQRDRIISELEEINARNRAPATDEENAIYLISWVLGALFAHFACHAGWFGSLFLWPLYLVIELIKWIF